jgi:hypothetical protein
VKLWPAIGTAAGSRLFDDFCRFAEAQVRSGDLDPAYVLLRAHYEAEGIDDETAVWRTLLYVTWYHVGSAERAWKLFPSANRFDEVRAPALLRGYETGIERRGFRGNDLASAFIERVELTATSTAGSLWRWVTEAAAPGGTLGWETVRQTFQAIPHAGPWASYKWADLLKHVHGLSITASSIGDKLGETAGPIPGMVLLTGLPWSECASSVELQQEMHDVATQMGCPFRGLDQLETALCDFNSLAKGRYYHGHDIDSQMAQLSEGSRLWKGREAFAERFRGELGGWNGVRSELKSAYANGRGLVNL